MTVLLLLQFGFLLFLFPFWVLWLGLSRLCCVKVGSCVLFLILEEMFSVFHHWTDASNGFVIYRLYYLEVLSLCAHFLESFYHKWLLNFIKSPFCIYWDDHIVLILQFVSVVYHVDWFTDIKKSLHLWNKSHLIIYNPFNVLLWDFLVAQTVKNLPAMKETWIWSLGQEDPLKKVMATHSSILAWRFPWTEESGGLQSWGRTESDTIEWLTLSLSQCFVGVGLLVFCWEFLHLYSSVMWVCNFPFCHIIVWFWYQCDASLFLKHKNHPTTMIILTFI